VRAVVTQAGGTVSVDSTPGCSTCFTIVLPEAAVPASPVPEAVGGPTATPGAGTVLVVDDDRTIGILVRRTLERHGYTVETVTSPMAALQRADALGDAMSLIVTDLTMRGMSGLQLIATLRQRRANLPALIMTGQPDAESLPEIGPDTHLLAKPFELSALLEHVRELTAVLIRLTP
jgi:CheY-like chemotaxis protein